MERKLVEQLRSTVSVSKRKVLDAAADAIERLCLKCVEAAVLLDEIETEAQTAIKYEQRVHMDWVADRIGEWKREQTDAELMVRIDLLRELAQAHKDGRLVVSPCKVGDAVYCILEDSPVYYPDTEGWYVSEETVHEITTKGLILHEIEAGTSVYVEPFDQIGKTVFLTREEAEAALKKEETDG